ncbi:hypothetical protein HMPREF9078_01278, partial [Capnocytophaga sp. oral taxon 380 str. F0488]
FSPKPLSALFRYLSVSYDTPKNPITNPQLVKPNSFFASLLIYYYLCLIQIKNT